MAEEKSEKKGLDNVTIWLMVSVAFFFDVLQWLLDFIFMAWLVTIFAWLTFYVWFKIRGMSFATPKRATVLGIGTVIDLIPILGALAWTAMIITLALDSKIKKVVGAMPGGQIAGSVLANKMGVARGNSSIREQASQINQPESLKRNENHLQPRSNQMEEWRNTSNKLSNVETSSLISKNYKGGTEKYAKDF